ncbi:ABC transporter permease subunit [Mesorhizobium sp. M5C.F.Ca.IN.020.32.2.1]|uniref:ABC transporter permease subunit n=1 Tax=Mesorhizobium sp. M5C.F.Ca.IN.020.32.2.1 TaxID=2496771 RepID=UPI000FD39592|nr:ABC transporter permease subunit [Mesorhizobium sp. M5C.F.Ca.IN.020.32.2.1]RUV31037.1 ABC transporter permease subunit [Mesorhizobium sp. M5C.F.Ca.IN.020.32.2.1]
MERLLRNQKVRNALLQIVFVGILAFIVIGGGLVARQNLIDQGIVSGFDFLFKSTGWDVNFSLLPVTASDPYWWFFVNGIINTLFLGSFGLLLATLIGAVVGLARTSSNELAQLLGRSYVDFFRNIPLILQVIFWYAVFTRLPPPRAALDAGGFLLSNRGLYAPFPNVSAPAMLVVAAAIIAAIVLPIWLGKTEHLDRPREKRLPFQLGGMAIALLCAFAALWAGRLPDLPLLDIPRLQGLNLRGGLRIPPEFMALVVGMAIYGGAYIGEIVRGGFKAVGRGQVEAAQSLGLSPWRIFSRVRLPLALRAMLPILANQYVWLIKATTMGIVVGFTDFFMITALTINHSGQTLEAIFILMAGFLTINLSLAAVFNRINKAIALKGNQLRG